MILKLFKGMATILRYARNDTERDPGKVRYRELPHQRERCGMLCKSLRGLKIHQARTAFCKEQEEPDAKADAAE